MDAFLALVLSINLLIVWSIITVILVGIVLSLALSGHPMSHIDMLLGMGLGMSTGPLMMVGLKRWRTRIKVNKILDDIIRSRNEETSVEETKQRKEEHISLIN